MFTPVSLSGILHPHCVFLLMATDSLWLDTYCLYLKYHNWMPWWDKNTCICFHMALCLYIHVFSLKWQWLAAVFLVLLSFYCCTVATLTSSCGGETGWFPWWVKQSKWARSVLSWQLGPVSRWALDTWSCPRFLPPLKVTALGGVTSVIKYKMNMNSLMMKHDEFNDSQLWSGIRAISLQ